MKSTKSTNIKTILLLFAAITCNNALANSAAYSTLIIQQIVQGENNKKLQIKRIEKENYPVQDVFEFSKEESEKLKEPERKHKEKNKEIQRLINSPP